MYRILIVDDEMIERRGIRFLLKKVLWDGMEISIAEAKNGKEALEYLKEHEVDILLTDVKMPFMDGLELIRNIMPRDDIKIVIFSGYSEFEYARMALQLGVKNYILKPVDPKEFEETILEIMKELQEEKVKQELKEKESNFMREHVVYSLVNGISLETTMRKAEGIAQLDFLKEFDRMILIEFSDDFFGKIGVDFSDLLKKQMKWKFFYLNLNPSQCLVFFKDENEKNGIQEATETYEWIQERFGIKPYIAISKKIEKIEQLSKIFEQLELLMESKFYQLEQHIFFENTDENTMLISQINDDLLLKKIKQDLRMKDINTLKEDFYKLCEKYRKSRDFSQVYIKFIFSSLLKDFYRNLPKEKEREFNQDIDRLYRAEQFSEVMEVIAHTIEYLEDEFKNTKSCGHKELDEVKKYISNHYGEEIGVEKLADIVYMTPSYLSYLFKKETGQNLSKYIKSYRMEKAKEKLEQTKGKIVNISYEVGYPNVSYFCQSFREYFGVTPQKYRDSGEEF